MYFGAKEYERSNQIIGYVLKRDLSCLDAVNLPQHLDGMADNYEHIGEQYSKLYKELYCQTYYVTDFFGFEKPIPGRRLPYRRGLCGRFDHGEVSRKRWG